MSFSAMTLKGLKQLEIDLTPEEEQGYMHCRNIVGYFIGLDKSLLPYNLEDGWNLGIAIIKRNYEPSKESKALTHALIDYSQNFFKPKLLKQVPAYFMAYLMSDVEALIGKDISKELGIHNRVLVNVFNWKLTQGIFYLFDNLEHKSLFIQKIAEIAIRLVMEGMIHHYLKVKSVPFYLPEELNKL